MSENNHTRGEWITTTQGWSVYAINENGLASGFICCVAHNKAERTLTALANSRLITTAPDGLALANLVIESHRCGFSSLTKGDWQAIVDAAFALKNKAEGQ